MQSAHNDIGYTHPREQIMSMYLDHYDRVLDLCRQTAGAPEAARFKWTCEVAWQVHHYLTARPDREEEFLRHVRAGQIELTAAYLHFTDLIDADAYRRSLAWAVAYARRHDLPLRCAVHSDINGWPWAVADLLAEAGIPYFCSHVHHDSATDPLGRRGSALYQWTLPDGLPLRADAPIRVPQAFWWEGPAGGRELHWLNEHYTLGNVLGVSSPQGFHADQTRYFVETDRLTADDLYARAEREVPRYVGRLRAEGDPHDALLLSTGGFYTDNAPPDARWLEVIARWNDAHDDIRLRTATVGEWFDWLVGQDDDAWPARRVAWPDGWAHGLGSMTARVAQARRTQRRRASAVALVDRAGTPDARAALEAALAEERMALEHTFNAWSTTARPAAAISDFEHAAKSLTFHRAALSLDDALTMALRAVTPPVATPRLFAHVDHADASRVLHFDAGDQHPDPETSVLADDAGGRHAFQRDSPEEAEPRYVAVVPAGASGLRGFELTLRATGAQGGGPSGSPRGDTLETAGWRLRVDPATGGLRGLRHRPTGRDWVDAGRALRFGQLVHETVVHPLGREAVGNLARLIALDVASDTARRGFADGPIVAHSALTIVGEAARIGRGRIAWRLYHALPLVELVLDWDKVWSDLPHAAYVAFPFAIDGERLLLETGGGFFQPGSHAAGGQLPGTCSSYYTVQRAARLARGDGTTLVWLPLDAPLVMPNRIDFNNWETGEWAWNGFLASMPVNHYWHTNFPTSQRGPLRLRYRLFSPDDMPDDEAAIRAALPLEAVGWR